MYLGWGCVYVQYYSCSRNRTVVSDVSGGVRFIQEVHVSPWDASNSKRVLGKSG